MRIQTIFDKEFWFRKNNEIDDSDDFEQCEKKYRKKAGSNKQELKNLEILRKDYEAREQQDKAENMAKGARKGREQVVKSVKVQPIKHKTTPAKERENDGKEIE